MAKITDLVSFYDNLVYFIWITAPTQFCVSVFILSHKPLAHFSVDLLMHVCLFLKSVYC